MRQIRTLLLFIIAAMLLAGCSGLGCAGSGGSGRSAGICGASVPI